MKTLYFDIDGTILVDDENSVKAALAGGGLETAVKAAGYQALVCVGNFSAIAKAVKSLGVDYEEIGVLFNLCRGAFKDEGWLRSCTVLVDDPSRRAEYIDFSGDWWYVDDLAKHYMDQSGQGDIFREYIGHRILAPDPKGDGRDILEWLGATAL